MNIYIEGPDGAGKSTLIKHIEDKYKCKMVHSSSETENTYDYHLNLACSKEDLVLDRFNLGEIIYPAIYSREPKMSFDEHMRLMRIIETSKCPYIIFYASNFEDLKERLFKRGDTEQVLKNAEKINLCFKLLAEQLSSTFENVIGLDISKVKDQVAWFDSHFEQQVLDLKENKLKAVDDSKYKYIIIEGEANQVEQDITRACYDGFEVVSSNSFPISKPDMINSKVNIIIVYTVILRRKFKEGM